VTPSTPLITSLAAAQRARFFPALSAGSALSSFRDGVLAIPLALPFSVKALVAFQTNRALMPWNSGETFMGKDGHGMTHSTAFAIGADVCGPSAPPVFMSL
jgi:hypothetical protein